MAEGIGLIDIIPKSWQYFEIQVKARVRVAAPDLSTARAYVRNVIENQLELSPDSYSEKPVTPRSWRYQP